MPARPSSPGESDLLSTTGRRLLPGSSNDKPADFELCMVIRLVHPLASVRAASCRRPQSSLKRCFQFSPIRLAQQINTILISSLALMLVLSLQPSHGRPDTTPPMFSFRATDSSPRAATLRLLRMPFLMCLLARTIARLHPLPRSCSSPSRRLRPCRRDADLAVSLEIKSATSRLLTTHSNACYNGKHSWMAWFERKMVDLDNPVAVTMTWDEEYSDDDRTMAVRTVQGNLRIYTYRDFMPIWGPQVHICTAEITESEPCPRIVERRALLTHLVILRSMKAKSCRNETKRISTLMSSFRASCVRFQVTIYNDLFECERGDVLAPPIENGKGSRPEKSEWPEVKQWQSTQFDSRIEIRKQHAFQPHKIRRIIHCKSKNTFPLSTTISSKKSKKFEKSHISTSSPQGLRCLELHEPCRAKPTATANCANKGNIRTDCPKARAWGFSWVCIGKLLTSWGLGNVDWDYALFLTLLTLVDWRVLCRYGFPLETTAIPLIQRAPSVDAIFRRSFGYTLRLSAHVTSTLCPLASFKLGALTCTTLAAIQLLPVECSLNRSCATKMERVPDRTRWQLLQPFELALAKGFRPPISRERLSAKPRPRIRLRIKRTGFGAWEDQRVETGEREVHHDGPAITPFGKGWIDLKLKRREIPRNSKQDIEEMNRTKCQPEIHIRPH
ncbi:uncharacterized protein MYCFIDRAFT_177559 [Pseudocercospora fijiensis CIRAD86]|uniref:Uncharacterized protein n=1 Tax=Pseudocercospora fijiensis (strain CIRAD86) TaxID=383855 RepID=M2ZNF6_PSEFD|nr:uncharacterized protein MYCFIDRAFT_177559 [Pseudocercospora fijiensis CIRAD86]EME80629.1 hypothetical protein MYCFIDRAFT_177559 [Pseudocercospora fijiensis CIRAD86]